MSRFVHLHVHSQYSILDGQAAITRLVDKAMADLTACPTNTYIRNEVPDTLLVVTTEKVAEVEHSVKVEVHIHCVISYR